MTRRENHRQTVTLPDGTQVEFVNRPVGKDGKPQWFVATGEFVGSEANWASIEQQLAQAIDRFGPVRSAGKRRPASPRDSQ